MGFQFPYLHSSGSRTYDLTQNYDCVVHENSIPTQTQDFLNISTLLS